MVINLEDGIINGNIVILGSTPNFERIGDIIKVGLEEFPQILTYTRFSKEDSRCHYFFFATANYLSELKDKYDRIAIIDVQSPLNKLAGNPSIETLIRGALRQYNPKDMLFENSKDNNKILMYFNQ